jgi:hypothetical protein
LNPDLGTDGFNRKDAKSAKRDILRSKLWILSVVLCLVLVSGVGAQEEAIEQLTPIVLDEVLGIDTNSVSHIAFCKLRDCLIYVDETKKQIFLVDLANMTEIRSKSLPSFEGNIVRFLVSPDDNYVSFETSYTYIFVWDIEADDVFELKSGNISETPPFFTSLIYWRMADTNLQLVAKDGLSGNREVDIWNIKTRQSIPQIIMSYWVSGSLFITFDSYEGIT